MENTLYSSEGFVLFLNGLFFFLYIYLVKKEKSALKNLKSTLQQFGFLNHIVEYMC